MGEGVEAHMQLYDFYFSYQLCSSWTPPPLLQMHVLCYLLKKLCFICLYVASLWWIFRRHVGKFSYDQSIFAATDTFLLISLTSFFCFVFFLSSLPIQEPRLLKCSRLVSRWVLSRIRSSSFSAAAAADCVLFRHC